MRKISDKKRKFTNRSIFAGLTAILFLLVAFEAKADWFWKRRGPCETMVEPIVNKPLILTLVLKNKKDVDRAQHGCYQSILKDGDHRELYAYYKLYKYADDGLKRTHKGEDKAPNNIYHYMLFYANQNSRIFDEKTQYFKNEQGLYEQELKDFEDQMNQEEKIKSFAYIADNLATGTEGWVKIHDYRKSFEYLKKAAEAGDAVSQHELGACYFLGRDRYIKFNFEKNHIKSFKWIFLSTKHSKQGSYNYEESNRALRIVKKEMTAAELREADSQIEKWLKENEGFIKKHPLEINKMSKGEVKSLKQEYQKFIKENNLNQTPSTN